MDKQKELVRNRIVGASFSRGKSSTDLCSTAQEKRKE